MVFFRYSSNWALPLISVAVLAMAFSLGARSEGLALRIAATVNDDVVLIRDVEERVRLFLKAQRAGGRVASESPELFNSILNSLIDRKLQLQRAETLGVSVSQQRVDQVTASLVDQSGQSLEQFLEVRGIELGALRSEVRDDLLIAEAVGLDNREDLEVTEEAVDELLRDRLGENRQHEYLLENAIFDAGDEQLADVLSKISGEQFVERAKQGAQNADKLQMGWRHAEELPSAYREAIKGLRSGEVSKVLKLPNGLHVLHLVAIRPLVPGRTESKLAELRLIKFDHGVEDAQLAGIVEQLMSLQTTMEDAATSLDGEIVSDKFAIRDLPERMQNEMRFKAGVLGGPFAFDGGKVIALVINVQEQPSGFEDLRLQAEAIAKDEKFRKLQMEWIENLRSISRIVILGETG